MGPYKCLHQSSPQVISNPEGHAFNSLADIRIIGLQWPHSDPNSLNSLQAINNHEG